MAAVTTPAPQVDGSDNGPRVTQKTPPSSKTTHITFPAERTAAYTAVSPVRVTPAPTPAQLSRRRNFSGTPAPTSPATTGEDVNGLSPAGRKPTAGRSHFVDPLEQGAAQTAQPRTPARPLPLHVRTSATTTPTRALPARNLTRAATPPAPVVPTGGPWTADGAPANVAVYRVRRSSKGATVMEPFQSPTPSSPELAEGASPTTPAGDGRPSINVAAAWRAQDSNGVLRGPQGKQVVTSRPAPLSPAGNASGHPSRMGDLTRPADAYKIQLQPTHHRATLARRSRQPRRVLNIHLTKYPLMRRLGGELGYDVEDSEEALESYLFNMCWSDTVLPLTRLVRLSNWQRTNHFPSMYLLCRKGHLGSTLGRLRRKLPSHFGFYPRTWSMRTERLQFQQYMQAVRQRHLLKYFIMKPNSGCQGRGIVVTRDPFQEEDISLDNYIVQEYVHRPLLLENKKFDLRVYVLLTSIRHPSVFMFNDGLVRICTEDYEVPNEENIRNSCKHLTNYAVNKKSGAYVFNTDAEHGDVGNKRNFRFLNRWLTDLGHSVEEFWEQVGFIITKTILAAQPSIAQVYDSCFPAAHNDGYCCFEVLGFDVLVDQKMRPWLMEVNHTPSFATETPLDFDIKSKLVRETWNIINCKADDYERDRQRERDEFARRHMPPWAANHPIYGNQLSSSHSRRSAEDAQSTSSDPPLERSTAAASTLGPGEEEGMPAYVRTRRQQEDSRLVNYARIYPSKKPQLQIVYDTVQNLARAESQSTPLNFGPHSINGRGLLGHQATSAGSPRTRTTPVSSPTTSNQTGAAALTNPRPSYRSTVPLRSSNAGSPNTATPAPTSPTMAPPQTLSSRSSIVPGTPTSTATSGPKEGYLRTMQEDVQRRRRLSTDTKLSVTSTCSSSAPSVVTKEEAPISPRIRSPTTPRSKSSTAPPPLTSFVSQPAGAGASTSSHPASPDAAHGPLKVHTPRVAPVLTTAKASRTASEAASTPQAGGSSTTAPPVMAQVKPRQSEVHRRPHVAAEVHHEIRKPSIHETHAGKSPSAGRAGSLDAANTPVPIVVKREGSKRTSPELGPSAMEKPEPSEEELQRLATLQAQLDYAAAADPEPDSDEDVRFE